MSDASVVYKFIQGSNIADLEAKVNAEAANGFRLKELTGVPRPDDSGGTNPASFLTAAIKSVGVWVAVMEKTP